LKEKSNVIDEIKIDLDHKYNIFY